MVCRDPFRFVEGLGCLWLYKKPHQTFDEGLYECQRKGADMFETTNWERQQKLLYDFLISNRGI